MSATAAYSDAARVTLLRRINLAEILAEEALAEGRNVEPLDDEVLVAWDEARIRSYFSGVSPIALPAPVPSDVFAKWFPGLERSGTSTQTPKLSIVCFCSSGNAEDMFTSEGTGSRRSPSPLLAEVLAVQPPGRGNRVKEPYAKSAQELANSVFEVLGHRLATRSTQWVVISHSMGCWIAYELLRKCRSHGVPLPRAWFLSAMPSPDTPDHMRPWRQQVTLDESDFKDECRQWDINETVFSEGMWEMYQPLLRADFTLFDSYVYDGGDDGPFQELPIYSWWGTQDRRVTEHLVESWSKFTMGPFQCKEAPGNHLWPLAGEYKTVWLNQIVEKLEELNL